MATKKTFNTGPALTHSKRLVGYSFDSLTQCHAHRLLDHGTAQASANLLCADNPAHSTKAIGKAAQYARTIAYEKSMARRTTRMSKSLLAGFLLGISGFFLSSDLQVDFIAEARNLLHAAPSMQALEESTSAPVQAEKMAKPVQVEPHASSPPAVQVPLTLQQVAEPAQAVPAAAPAAPVLTDKVFSDKAGDSCTGARLAFGLCVLKE